MTGWTILQIIQGSVKHFEFSRTMIIINAIMVTFADFLLRCSWVHQTGFILHPSTNQLLNKHLNSYGFSIHPISCLLKISSWNKFHIIPGALVVSRLLWALMNTDILQKKKYSYQCHIVTPYEQTPNSENRWLNLNNWNLYLSQSG